MMIIGSIKDLPKLIVIILLIIIAQGCVTSGKDKAEAVKAEGESDVNELLESIRDIKPKEDLKITEIKYYRDYKQSYDGKREYIRKLRKEDIAGEGHLRLYYSKGRLVREEEYDKLKNLKRYTKVHYDVGGGKAGELWYTGNNELILERQYKKDKLLEEKLYESGTEYEKIKYEYKENILFKENHYDIYDKLLYYKTFDYEGERINKIHFYDSDGRKISTHKEYYKNKGNEKSEGEGYNAEGRRR